MDLGLAKERILDALAHEPWIRGVGVGLVDDRPGVVVSVEETAREAAEAAVASLDLDVPVRVRVIGPVTARPLERQESNSDGPVSPTDNAPHGSPRR